MYLNVTDLTTYNVGYESYCIRWTPHRAATSYRLKVNPVDGKSFNQLHTLVDFRFVRLPSPESVFPSSPLASKKGAQEITVRGSESKYCFDGLTPDSLYDATVFVQTPNLEGPGVSVRERTCKITSFMPV